MLGAHDPLDHVLPHPLVELFPLYLGRDTIPLIGFSLGGHHFYFTNHLLMTLVAAALCLLIFPRVAKAYANKGDRPRAPRGFVSFFEVLLQFVRQDVARPVLGARTDAFVPFLWTMFFFILFCNLLGMVPIAAIIELLSGGHVKHVGGTATANLAVTGGLAICAFFATHVAGVRQVYRALKAGTHGHRGPEEESSAGGHAGQTAHGLPGPQAAILAMPTYIWSFAPHVFARTGQRCSPGMIVRVIMLPVFVVILALEIKGIFQILGGPTAGRVGVWTGVVFGLIAAMCAKGMHWTDVVDVPMWAFLLLLEMIGAVIKPFALMIRLFANMVAGHVVLASILLLIFTASSIVMGYTVGVIAALGAMALSLLELFVAFLQAYIFVFLTTLFISMSVEPAH